MWDATVRAADERTRRPPLGTDAEAFAGLSAWSQLQNTCRERRPAFREGWRSAEPQNLAATMHPDVVDVVRETAPAAGT